MPDRRAVSDSIGFVLVFAIIISTVAVVYVGGFQSLDNARQFERMNNAERAFEVMADNVEDVVQRGAPSRATEIKLADASLQGGETGRINVTVVDTASGDERNVSWRSYQPIEYESQTDESNGLAYALGATFRRSDGTSVMKREPPMVLEEDRVVVPIIATDNVGTTSITGSKTVLVRTEPVEGNSGLLMENTSGTYDVRINMSTSRASAWRTYFEDSGAACPGPGLPSDPNDDTFVSCTVTDVDVVYVTLIDIDYEFL